MSLAQERQRAVAQTMEKIRNIEAQHGMNRPSLGAIQSVLLSLAAQAELFPLEDFSPQTPLIKKSSCLFRLAEEADHRHALYVNSALGTYETPVHNHATWVVIVGMQGEELNKLYRLSEQGGVMQQGEFVVRKGTGIGFLPDDLHSVHIVAEEAPLLNFHLYGRALEHLQGRRFYVPETNTWRIFPTQSNIREARWTSSSE